MQVFFCVYMAFHRTTGIKGCKLYYDVISFFKKTVRKGNKNLCKKKKKNKKERQSFLTSGLHIATQLSWLPYIKFFDWLREVFLS